MGPAIVIVKKGESGSIMSNSKGEKFILPAWPATVVKDPTGAGDSFAGAFMGRLTETGKTDAPAIKEAIAYGTVAASFAISDFSIDGLASITRADIDKRLHQLKKLVQF